MAKKKLKVGFDLDGVIVDKPFFVPKLLIEWLYRAHDGNNKKYRYPKFKPEIWLRQLSHHWFLRRPLKKNLKEIKKFIHQTRANAFIISGRYNFLQKKTKDWFDNYRLNGVFKSININFSNQQPHLFKERVIKRLKPKYYFDDDPIAINYLKQKIPDTKFFLVKNNLKEILGQLSNS